MILAAGLSPAWQQIVCLPTLQHGEVNRASAVHYCASGKVLNVGIALHHLGGESLTLSPVGGIPATAIQQEFAQLAAPCRWIHTAAPTRVCVTVLETSTGLSTELVENAHPLTAAEIEQYIAAYLEEVPRARAVVLTGSLPAGTPTNFYQRLLQSTPVPAVLDIRGPELLAALACKPLVVKPNREELGHTFGRPITTDADLHSALSELHRRGAQWAVVSQGGGPVCLSSADQILHFHPPRISLVNAIGSGDCLAAGLAHSLTLGHDLPTSLRFALSCASHNATQLLPARLHLPSIQQLVEQVK